MYAILGCKYPNGLSEIQRQQGQIQYALKSLKNCNLEKKNFYCISMTYLATASWKAQISSAVGSIKSLGSKNPYRPVSLNSTEYAYGIPAIPKAQSAEDPDAISIILKKWLI